MTNLCFLCRARCAADGVSRAGPGRTCTRPTGVARLRLNVEQDLHRHDQTGVIVTATALRARRGRLARTGRFRTALAAAALLAVLPTSACGMNAQTLKPYTPAEGVNFDVGDESVPDSVIHVRNLLIVSRSPGSGFVSASMVTTGRDTLNAVSGVPYRADSSKGTAFTATLSSPVVLANNAQVVLTDLDPFITITNATGLSAGLDADVTLQFGKAGSITQRTTVVDGNLPPYSQISPSANPSASPSLTAAPSPSASPTP